jgi:hypothetical protein
MLYVVSGFMRSGTSMMMQALEAGGMEAVYSQARNTEMNERFGEPDYLPNDNYYELDPADYRRRDLGERYDGKLIKCLWGGMMRMPPTECRIVFMRRPAREINVSLLAFFGQAGGPPPLQLDREMEACLAILRDRRSFLSVDEIWYADVVNDPAKVFTALRDAGWPIDVGRSAQVPNRQKMRNSHA